ncbi:MAG: VWA domain-containing protein [Chitinophaga sp.]|uniref:vWA domain-containing protein n=1 Tax=Chitinophaga sp. TaxID=1869181 RepID=UPI001B14ABF0|nr:hypothetical protein [Chitinophaga sp.]MBO9731426.1 VWA domain-containing protein [Chitinophaga sp.]
MKTALLACALLASGFALRRYEARHPISRPALHPVVVPKPSPSASPSAADNTHIQVALLLDTSNSMDGLIDQAKSRLWNIINTLTTLRDKGKAPVIEIALYEYGNDGLPREQDYIRQVTPLTTDLDLISEKLFALRTNGGSEYCGAVIRSALNSLHWGADEADMKLIYIAGNESFNQGEISYKRSTADAVNKNIFVSTIYCGDKRSGIGELWKDGADRGRGEYFNIDSDRKVAFITTPYDAQIEACNDRINKTYIAYGVHGASKKSNQVIQDSNAKSLSSANSTERYVSKSKAIYKNESWDLVDRVEQDKSVLKTMTKTDLPQELQNKTPEEMYAIIKAKGEERVTIQKEIATLAKQREKYIAEASKNVSHTDDLGAAINGSIIRMANAKGYQVEK